MWSFIASHQWGFFLNGVCRILCVLYICIFSLFISLLFISPFISLSIYVYNYACVYVLCVLCMYEIGGGGGGKFQLNGCGERNDGELC